MCTFAISDYWCSSMLPLSETRQFLQSSSFWEARCALIGQLSSALWLAKYLKRETEMLRPSLYCDAVSRRDETKTIKSIINEAFVASSGDIITDYNDLDCLFTTLPCLHLWSEKQQTTSTTLHCSKLAFESSVAETFTGGESEASDCPCKVGISPLYRNSLWANQNCRLLSQVQEIVLFWNSVVNTT